MCYPHRFLSKNTKKGQKWSRFGRKGQKWLKNPRGWKEALPNANSFAAKSTLISL